MKICSQIYIKGTIEATEFYKKAFGLTLGFNVRNEDNTFAHASLMLGEIEFLAIAERQDKLDVHGIYICPDKYHPIMQFNVVDLGEEGVRKAYEILKEGAIRLRPLEPCPWSELCSGLIDKFGVFWWIAK